MPANMIYISAQPDHIYFHWQVEIYRYQFAKHGIQDQCYSLFGYRGSAPSAAGLELAKKYPNILFYKDTRNISGPNHYIPSIRPHVYKQFFAEHPDKGSAVFVHDSDIFLVKLPPFDRMLGDDVGYLSDTISYIGHKYIMDCADRYKAIYPSLSSDDILVKMCDVVNIPPELVKANQENSGGAQYLLKNIDASYWAEVENATDALYNMLKNYEAQYPIAHHIQSWTVDMWTVLWIYWKRGGKTVVDPALSFSWATSSVKDYFTNNIFHLAGVTSELAATMFYKGAYNNKDIFAEYRKNKAIFDHVSPKNATYEYVKIIKEYVDKKLMSDDKKLMSDDKKPKTESVTRFLMESTSAWSDIYNKDVATIVLGRPLWRSVSGSYIIFYNTHGWILTHSRYESELNSSTGGFASSSGLEPYDDGWNHPCNILCLADKK
jgi:hypothetical protein